MAPYFPGRMSYIYLCKTNKYAGTTGTALDSFSFNTHNVGGVVTGGRGPKSIS